MPAIKRYLPVLFIIFLVCSNGCSTRNQPVSISPYASAIEQILATSGNNSPQLQDFMDSYDDSPEKRQAAQFLVANLPPADRVSLSAESLKENLDFAFLTRKSTPWGTHVSWTDFLHYVLPHRVSQEQAANWRKKFYNELLPIVSECGSMEEAVLAVNLWCFSKTGFESTQRWDQNPLMTINRGWGRCEEAVILTVSALRAVGIPARQAMVPAWQHSNDNHTWTEVMVDGKWHYIESANPDYGLDHAWFSGSARKAPLVLSYAYGQLLHADDPVLGRSFGCTLINTTQRYAPVSRTEITVLDQNGKPAPDTKIYFSVFNYASFRPVAAVLTDSEGKASIQLGPGSVLVSAAKDNSSAYVGSVWIPGKHKSRQEILLRLSAENIPEGRIFFPFTYKDTLALNAPPKNSEGTKKDKFNTIKKARLDKFKGIKSAAEIYPEELSSAITEAGLNAPQIMLALNTCPKAYLGTLENNIRKMDTADLLQVNYTDLISNAELAESARKQAERAGLVYDNNIFEDFVLNQRIMYEQLRYWRADLFQIFNFNDGKNLRKTIQRIGAVTKSLAKTVRGPLGCSIDPSGVLKSKTVSTDSETAVFATAAMRSAGIPARYLDEQGWVEFYNGKTWEPFYPQSPDQTGNRNATAASKAYYGPWKTVKFRLPGFNQGDEAARYFKDFTISKLNENSFFTIVEKTVRGKVNEAENTWEIAVPTGNNFLISAKRNKNNEPNISIIKIK